MHVITQIENLVSPLLQAMGYVFWGCEYFPNHNPALVRIYIDKEHGIALTDCARASTAISAVLDVHFAIEKRYHLEVSSPGVERLLFKEAHFQRYCGSKIVITAANQAHKTSIISGYLMAVNTQGIDLRLADDKTLFLRYSDIQKAQLMVGAV